MMQNNTDNAELRLIIESLLFANERPVIIDQVKSLLQGLDAPRVRDAFLELKKEYEDNKRGIRIVEVADGFQMVSAPNYAEILKKFFKKHKVERLTKPSLEVLSIIAYRQPVTRHDIDSIRGVACEGVVDNLMAKGLVRIAGRKKTPGRPFVFGTTRQFLEYFGLRSLEDLPNIKEFSKMAQEITKSDEVEQITEEVAGKQDNISEVQVDKETQDANKETAQ